MKRPLRGALTAVAIGVATLGLAAPAFAEPILDQSYSSNLDMVPVIGPTQWVSQGFTAGVAGTLARVEGFLVYGSGNGDLVVGVYDAGIDGCPSGTSLGSSTLTSNDVPLYTGPLPAATSISFANTIQLLAGEHYAIQFSQTGTAAYGAFATSNVISDGGQISCRSSGLGTAWSGPINPFGFATYVNPTTDGGWIIRRQSVALPTLGTCADVQDADLDFDTRIHGGWQRAWEPWVVSTDPAVHGGWACSRALVNKGGSTWIVDNSVL